MARTTAQCTTTIELPRLEPPFAAHVAIPRALIRAFSYLEIIIPARDEALRLPSTLLRTISYLEKQRYSSSIVVIDNGSVDQTADVVFRTRSERVPVHLAGCAQRGKGAAIRRGFLTSRAKFVGYMDADLATPIETLDIVMPLLEEHPVVVGSRRIDGAAVAVRQSVHRLVGGHLFRMLARQQLPNVTDTQCGFKFFAGELIGAVAPQLRIDGYAFDVELLRRITDMGIVIKEVPVVWSDGGDSSLRVIRDGIRSTSDLLSLARTGCG